MLISRLLFCLRMASSSAKIFKESADAMLSCGPRPAGRRGPRETCAFGESEIRTVYFSNINLTRKIRSSQEKVGTTPLVGLYNKRGGMPPTPASTGRPHNRAQGLDRIIHTEFFGATARPQRSMPSLADPVGGNAA